MSSKLREAVCRLVREIEDGMLVEISSKFEQDLAKSLLADVKSALAKPLRNCDVGDTEEQFARFKKWCEGEFYKRPMNALTGEPCKSCPCYSVAANGVNGCNYLRWSQMPYESEVKR